MANRMDDNNSITACQRGLPRSSSGRETTVVMVAFEKRQSKKMRQEKPDRQRNGGAVPATNNKGRKTGL
jgi:hypothetical protein